MASIATVTVELEYDVAVAALSEIRNATLIWPRDAEAMSAKLRAINAIAQCALESVITKTDSRHEVADSPAFVAATLAS